MDKSWLCGLSAVWILEITGCNAICRCSRSCNSMLATTANVAKTLPDYLARTQACNLVTQQARHAGSIGNTEMHQLREKLSAREHMRNPAGTTRAMQASQQLVHVRYLLQYKQPCSLALQLFLSDATSDDSCMLLVYLLPTGSLNRGEHTRQHAHHQAQPEGS